MGPCVPLHARGGEEGRDVVLALEDVWLDIIQLVRLPRTYVSREFLKIVVRDLVIVWIFTRDMPHWGRSKNTGVNLELCIDISTQPLLLKKKKLLTVNSQSGLKTFPGNLRYLIFHRELDEVHEGLILNFWKSAAARRKRTRRGRVLNTRI